MARSAMLFANKIMFSNNLGPLNWGWTLKDILTPVMMINVLLVFSIAERVVTNIEVAVRLVYSVWPPGSFACLIIHAIKYPIKFIPLLKVKVAKICWKFS